MAKTTVPATDAKRAADESVLAGVTVPESERKGNGGASPAAAAKLAEIAKNKANGSTPAAKPPVRRTRRQAAPVTVTHTEPTAPATKAPAKAKPATPAKATPATPARRSARKAPATPAPEPAPVPAAAAVTARQDNQKLAREVADLLAEHFGDRDEATQTKIANWVKSLPTGGAAWKRYWPKGFARPTSADWVVPAGETLPE